MTVSPPKQASSRHRVLIVILVILFLIVTSQFPLLEILADLWSQAWLFAGKLLGILAQAIHSW